MAEFVQREAVEVLWRKTYTLEREEIARGLLLGDPRKKSKLRVIIEATVLCLAALYFFIGWLTSADKASSSGLTLTLVCVFVFGMLLLGPRMNAESSARRLVKEQPPIEICACEGDLFGLGCGEELLLLSPAEVSAFFEEQLLAIPIAAEQLVIVPRRVLSEEQWDWLCSRFVNQKGE